MQTDLWKFICKKEGHHLFVSIIVPSFVLVCTIIALKASGRDCTNKNELLHKKGVLQRYAMKIFIFTSELLQAVRWRSKYNGCTQRI